MPVVANDTICCRTADSCRMVGISRDSLYWSLNACIVTSDDYSDWRGWRLLTPLQVETIRIETNSTTAIRQNSQGHR